MRASFVRQGSGGRGRRALILAGSGVVDPAGAAVDGPVPDAPAPVPTSSSISGTGAGVGLAELHRMSSLPRQLSGSRNLTGGGGGGTSRPPSRQASASSTIAAAATAAAAAASGPGDHSTTSPSAGSQQLPAAHGQPAPSSRRSHASTPAAATAPPPPPPRPRLPSSLLVRRNMGWSALRWLGAGLVTTAITVWLEMTQSSECATSRAGSMLAIWIAVATARIVTGGLLRSAVWAGWDVHSLPEHQPPLVFMMVRAEFILLLLTVMWTTIGFLYIYGAQPPCGNQALSTYAMALVVVLYVHFAAPILLSIALRCSSMCRCCGWVTQGLQRMAAAGVFAAPQVPASETQIRRLPQEKFRKGRFPADNAACVICFADYADGDWVRVLPCGPSHHFHRDCIDTWLKQQSTCPICRTSMVDPAWARSRAELQTLAVAQSGLDVLQGVTPNATTAPPHTAAAASGAGTGVGAGRTLSPASSATGRARNSTGDAAVNGSVDSGPPPAAARRRQSPQQSSSQPQTPSAAAAVPSASTASAAAEALPSEDPRNASDIYGGDGGDLSYGRSVFGNSSGHGSRQLAIAVSVAAEPRPPPGDAPSAAAGPGRPLSIRAPAAAAAAGSSASSAAGSPVTQPQQQAAPAQHPHYRHHRSPLSTGGGGISGLVLSADLRLTDEIGSPVRRHADPDAGGGGGSDGYDNGEGGGGDYYRLQSPTEEAAAGSAGVSRAGSRRVGAAAAVPPTRHVDRYEGYRHSDADLPLDDESNSPVVKAMGALVSRAAAVGRSLSQSFSGGGRHGSASSASGTPTAAAPAGPGRPELPGAVAGSPLGRSAGPPPPPAAGHGPDVV